jgi:hypothetical protein
MPFDPNYKHIVSSEEYYEDMYDFGGDYDYMPEDMEDECPEWIQEQLDEEMPF